MKAIINTIAIAIIIVTTFLIIVWGVLEIDSRYQLDEPIPEVVTITIPTIEDCKNLYLMKTLSK
jgi:hypothetical protein